MRPSRFLLVMFVSLAAPFLLTDSSQAQVVTDILSFTGANGSVNPVFVTPTQGRDGKLYGTASGFPDSSGAIFKVQTTGAGGILHTFDGTDGALPAASVVLATDANYYGTTFSGGSPNLGVLFQIASSGLYTAIHEFQGGTDGSNPYAAPIEASDGNLYGTTNGNGLNASTVYRYSLSTRAFTTIYQFDGTYGSSVVAPLIQATDGNLYGTAQFGGTNSCGTIFKLSTSGTPLFSYNFLCNGKPSAPLVQASDGNFYGTTPAGGTLGFGTVYKMTPKGHVTILYNFAGKTQGDTPVGGLVQATDGILYGSTETGGDFGKGTIFKLSTSGNYNLLYSFPSKVGTFPEAALLQHTNGLLYGTVQGGPHGDGAVYSLNMSLSRFVTFVRPSGADGSTAQILGQGLTGVTSVTFNGVEATSSTVVTDTYMTAVVPSGATTGKVVVTTPSGPLTSNVNFRILN